MTHAVLPRHQERFASERMHDAEPEPTGPLLRKLATEATEHLCRSGSAMLPPQALGTFRYQVNMG